MNVIGRVTATDHPSKISTGTTSETTFGRASVVTEISNPGMVRLSSHLMKFINKIYIFNDYNEIPNHN